MKKVIYIIIFLFSGLTVWAQPPGPPPEGEGPPDLKLPERMSAFIQNKLEMSASEREKFEPAFKLYLKDLLRISRENRGDRLIMQQQIVELRLKYRKDFRQWLGDQRGDRIFLEEERFRGEVLRMLRERRKGRMGPPSPPGGRRRFN